MKRMLYTCFFAFLCLCGIAQAAREILLRTAPEAGAPVIAKVTASEKVILDAAPAPRNAEFGWRQLALPSPFEGYVPIAAISKNFEIVGGTPVHYLPTTKAARITSVENSDDYEVIRVKDEWATVRFHKDITGYFIGDATEEVVLNRADITNEPVPQPVAIPAPRTRVNPDEPISQLDPSSLPPENVFWKPALRSDGLPDLNLSKRNRHNPQPDTPAKAVAATKPRIPNPDLMVTPAQTQAREAAPELGPAKTPRLLAGILKQDLSNDGSVYPIRLKSPEGRLIAYVDFSGIYISDLTPYLDQKVYIRGQIHPLPESSAQLVILAENLRLAE